MPRLLAVTSAVASALLALTVLRQLIPATAAGWSRSPPTVPNYLSRPLLRVLVCETRPAERVAWTYLALEHRLSHSSSTMLSNICANWTQTPGALGAGLDFTRLRALRKHLASLDPEQLVLWLDTDVVLNAPPPDFTSRVVRAFHAARGLRRILFQGEPFCWAPHGNTRSTTRGCSAAVIGSYSQLHSAGVDWRCARYLNSGGFVGFAADTRRMLDVLDEVRANNSRTPIASERLCYFEGSPGDEKKLSDQCLLTHALLRHSDWIGVDVDERIFATAASAVPLCLGNASCVANSMLAAPCGDVLCRMSTQLNWHRRSVAAGGAWTRGDTERQRRCTADGLADGAAAPPLVIHFNNRAGKVLMKRWPEREE